MISKGSRLPTISVDKFVSKSGFGAEAPAYGAARKHLDASAGPGGLLEKSIT